MCAASGGPEASVSAMTEVRDIGSRLELFVDDWLIEEMRDVRLRMHAPIPQEVALAFDRPWEGPFSYDPVVMLDPTPQRSCCEGKAGDRYRLWYRGCGDDWDGQVTAYAESCDGVHWERPNLGIHAFEGSRENNTVLRGSDAKALCVFKDANPEAAETQRYKAIGVGPKTDGRDTIRGFTSPDGLSWQPLDRDPILIAPEDPWPMFDTHNVAFWDTEQRQYVAYLRGWLPPGIRSIRRSVSADFRDWSEPEFIDLGDSPDEHLYKNACTQYFRAPHHYLMFPKRFVPDRRTDPSWDADGLSESVFMTSRDGTHWDRRFMEAFLRPGPDVCNWTDRNMYIGVGVVPTGPAEMSIYYLEHYRRPTCRLRRAILRTDGFASVNARYSGGEIVTRPLRVEGRDLAINYSTSAVGSIRVELQDAEGGPIAGHTLSECEEIFGDEIERVVRWEAGSSMSRPNGKPIRVRLAMKDADLYAMRFCG